MGNLEMNKYVWVWEGIKHSIALSFWRVLPPMGCLFAVRACACLDFGCRNDHPKSYTIRVTKDHKTHKILGGESRHLLVALQSYNQIDPASWLPHIKIIMSPLPTPPPKRQYQEDRPPCLHKASTVTPGQNIPPHHPKIPWPDFACLKPPRKDADHNSRGMRRLFIHILRLSASNPE